MEATKAAAQTGAPDRGGCNAGGGTGGSDVGGGVGDWDVSSGTGSGDACGGCEAVEDRKCTGAGDPSIGLGRLCWHNFEHNRTPEHKGIHGT